MADYIVDPEEQAAYDKKLEKYEKKQASYERRVAEVKSIAEENQKEIIEAYKNGAISFEKAIDELTNASFAYTQRIKERTQKEELLSKAVEKNTKLFLEQSKLQAPTAPTAPTPRKATFWEQIKSGDDKLDWRIDRQVNAINSIMSGNFKYGALQFAQTFKLGKNLLGHPLIQFSTVAAKLAIALSDFNYRSDRLANRLAGGSDLSPNAKNKKWEDAGNAFALTAMYNQKKDDYNAFRVNQLGQGQKASLMTLTGSQGAALANAWSYGRFALEDRGGDPNKMGNLIQQQLVLGKTPDTLNKFNYRLMKAIDSLDKLSTNQFLQTYEDLNKTLMANHMNGTASAKSLATFQDALAKGTISVNDFTKSLTSRRQASTSALAGVGAMLAENGLGGKELIDAYNRGDMIRVAGIMRRGGNNISRDVEKLTRIKGAELMDQLGTSDLREILALQSETAWGQLGPDLKNLTVQNTLANGGSMTVALDKDSQKLTAAEDLEMKQMQHNAIHAATELKGSLDALTEVIKMGGYAVMQKDEQNPELKKQAILGAAAFSNPLLIPNFMATVKLGNPNHTN